MPLELREGVVLAGRYRLQRRLGEGGMGIVWAAANTVTGRGVALKMLRGDRAEDPKLRRRFLREGRTAAAVQHPNVVEIIDVVELDGGAPAIVMELLEGESLGARLRRERALSLRDVAQVMLPTISAVGTAHAHGIVHRDLKPDNIFLARGLDDVVTVKVLDFGIAKMTATDGEPAMTEGLTGTGAMLGTPYYMSPEQLFADETIDYRSDIWALGVILYECIAGVRPVQGDNFAHLVKKIAMREMIPLASVSPETPAPIAELVTRMLAVEKEDRPQSLREVRDALRDFSDVMATTFGDPVLAPVRVKPSPDSSGALVGVLREDLELLRTSSDERPPHSGEHTTLDAPSALGNTHNGVGVTVSSRGRPLVSYVVGGVVVVAALTVGARALVHSPSPPAPSIAASAPPPPPPDTAAIALTPPPLPSAPASASAVAASASAPASASASRGRPHLPPAVTPNARPSATNTGGLVEKPPF